MRGVHDVVKRSAPSDDQPADEQTEERERRQPVDASLGDTEALHPTVLDLSHQTVASAVLHAPGGAARRLEVCNESAVQDTSRSSA